MSSHHWMKFGCHCSSARWSFLSPARLTLLGIFSLVAMLLMDLSCFRESSPPVIEHRPLRSPVGRERALLPDRVGALEDPVLPGGQAAEDLGLERFRSGEAQARLHPGQS